MHLTHSHAAATELKRAAAASIISTRGEESFIVWQPTAQYKIKACCGVELDYAGKYFRARVVEMHLSAAARCSWLNLLRTANLPRGN
jgi:hypothetical protein